MTAANSWGGRASAVLLRGGSRTARALPPAWMGRLGSRLTCGYFSACYWGRARDGPRGRGEGLGPCALIPFGFYTFLQFDRPAGGVAPAPFGFPAGGCFVSFPSKTRPGRGDGDQTQAEAAGPGDHLPTPLAREEENGEGTPKKADPTMGGKNPTAIQGAPPRKTAGPLRSRAGLVRGTNGPGPFAPRESLIFKVRSFITQPFR